MTFSVSLTTEAALAVSRWRATGNQIETLHYVPGTVWRGALAADVIRERNLGERAHEDEIFRAIFLSGNVRFGDLRPQGACPWPQSARVCGRNEAHGVHDLLVRSSLGGEIPVECDFNVSGEKCGAKLVGPSGFRLWGDYLPRRVDVPVRIIAHTAISNVTLRPRSGQFYTTEVIECSTELKGELWLRDEGLQAELCKRRTLTLGRGATRGQGLASIEVSGPLPAGPPLSERMALLNQRFQGTGLVAFTCTFSSPCLVLDPWLCARSYLNTEDIAEAVGATPQDFDGYKLYAWFSRMTSIGGWNARASLPKSELSVIAPGAVFLFAREVPEGSREAEVKRLASLLESCPKGVGERWEEGFGEAVFCDPFHHLLRRS